MKNSSLRFTQIALMVSAIGISIAAIAPALAQLEQETPLDTDEETQLEEATPETDTETQPIETPVDTDEETPLEEATPETDTETQPIETPVDTDEETPLETTPETDTETQPIETPVDTDEETPLETTPETDTETQPIETPVDTDEETPLETTPETDTETQPIETPVDTDEETPLETTPETDTETQPIETPVDTDEETPLETTPETDTETQQPIESPVDTEAETQPVETPLGTEEATPAQLGDPNQNLVAVAASSEQFSTLVSAVEAAGLQDTLANQGPYTIFAPTNEAFNQLPSGALEYLLQPENQDLLRQILTYHVVPEELTASEITTGSIDTLGGGIAIEVTPERVIVNNASVVSPDIQAQNGVIHAISRVLMPAAIRDRLMSELQAQ